MPVKDQCPLCRKPVNPQFSPFCSKGCRDRDLLAWLGEEYRTPGPPAEELDGGAGVRPVSNDDE
ncbi:MAG TPA: DNA gyrase inhibitor YacG [Sphingobium sp.]|uniref:DNA gyrase inhibitor YacG n=1 Tax=Sphingobium sp. TaxID=1912891 RepID=UPI002ED07F1F